MCPSMVFYPNIIFCTSHIYFSEPYSNENCVLAETKLLQFECELQFSTYFKCTSIGNYLDSCQRAFHFGNHIDSLKLIERTISTICKLPFFISFFGILFTIRMPFFGSIWIGDEKIYRISSIFYYRQVNNFG